MSTTKTYTHKGVSKKNVYIVVMTRNESLLRELDVQWVGHGKNGWYFCQLDQDALGRGGYDALVAYASDLRRLLTGANIDVIDFRNITYLGDDAEA